MKITIRNTEQFYLKLSVIWLWWSQSTLSREYFISYRCEVISRRHEEYETYTSLYHLCTDTILLAHSQYPA
jgi:hypothetical protein